MQESEVLGDILVRLYYTIKNFIVYPYIARRNKNK